MIDKPIYVTSPLLPPLEDFTFLLKEIWESKMLTNNGNFHQKLEEELAKYLKVPYLSLFTNGTLPLITALQAMRITGEVITTPFSFVATTHSLWWNGIKPVFVDIEPETCNLDPAKIEAAITPRTTAIMPVHVYGKPCKTKEIQEIANKYGLKVIYDAAHAFGVEINGESVLNFGDMATLSFHATKVYNTLEGGALVVHDEQTKKRIDYLKNFGFASETEVVAPGINSKVDEVRAAYGLLNLKQVDSAISSRRKVAIRYREELQDIKGITFFNDIPGVRHNYSYFPIFIDAEEYGMTRDELYFKMKEHNVFGRRYFYPLISTFSTYRGLESANPENLPIATQMANRVICLPMHHALSENEVEYILHSMIKLSEITKSISPSLTRRLFNLAQNYDNVIDFTLGDPDIHPHDKIKEAGCKAILEGRTRYSPNAGLLELREIISSRYKLQYNIEYNPTNEIMVTVGGMEGLYLTLLAILNRGDEVIIPAPYWINYVQMVCMCSGEPIITAPVSTNDLSISIENIRKAITPKTKAIILNTPSNPSGKIISDDSIQQIAQIAIDNDLIVITDEVYKTLLYDNAHFKSIVTCDKMKERTVVINSLSKEFCMTGWRLGYVAAPSELISAMTMFQENIAACAPLPSQYAAIEALRNSEKYSAGMIEEFTLRRNVLLEEVAKIKTITVDAPQGTFYAMLNIKSTGLKSEEFAYALLEKEQVAVVPGITYGDCCEDFIRIAFTLDIYKIKEGIQRLKRFVESL